jgi:hypothetical protein
MNKISIFMIFGKNSRIRQIVFVTCHFLAQITPFHSTQWWRKKRQKGAAQKLLI